MKKSILRKSHVQHPVSGDGSDETFEALVRNNLTWILALANVILKDPSKAEDAAQLAFLKIHQKLDQFEGRSALKTWMYRIAVNEALMILRKDRRNTEKPIDAMFPQFDNNGCRFADEMINRETGETILSKKQKSHEVQRLISDLPDQYRIVLLLRDIEEMTTAQVASILEISEANVRVRLHRARTVLKKRLEPFLSGGAF